MARMKFLCDAERCIDCNACVTACNNEHDVPWGINRRHVVTMNDGVSGEKSISVVGSRARIYITNTRKARRHLSVARRATPPLPTATIP